MNQYFLVYMLCSKIKLTTLLSHISDHPTSLTNLCTKENLGQQQKHQPPPPPPPLQPQPQPQQQLNLINHLPPSPATSQNISNHHIHKKSTPHLNLLPQHTPNLPLPRPPTLLTPQLAVVTHLRPPMLKCPTSLRAPDLWMASPTFPSQSSPI